jgi:hypothetical protein
MTPNNNFYISSSDLVCIKNKNSRKLFRNLCFKYLTTVDVRELCAINKKLIEYTYI